MEIVHVTYIKNFTEGSGSEQIINVQTLLEPFLKKIPHKSDYEHIAWIGVEENKFTEVPTVFAIAFYSGEWNNKQITDRIILDINNPMSDEFPSPFTELYASSSYDRAEFSKILKGGIVF